MLLPFNSSHDGKPTSQTNLLPSVHHLTSSANHKLTTSPLHSNPTPVNSSSVMNGSQQSLHKLASAASPPSENVKYSNSTLYSSSHNAKQCDQNSKGVKSSSQQLTSLTSLESVDKNGNNKKSSQSANSSPGKFNAKLFMPHIISGLRTRLCAHKVLVVRNNTSFNPVTNTVGFINPRI